MDDNTQDDWTLQISADWTPTPENQAALPPPVQAFIKQLEAKIAEMERLAQGRLHARLRRGPDPRTRGRGQMAALASRGGHIDRLCAAAGGTAAHL